MGTEDLGNGLKAVVPPEQGFNIDTGNSISRLEGVPSSGICWSVGGFGTVSSSAASTLSGYDFQYDAVVSSIISPQAIPSALRWAALLLLATLR